MKEYKTHPVYKHIYYIGIGIYSIFKISLKYILPVTVILLGMTWVDMTFPAFKFFFAVVLVFYLWGYLVIDYRKSN